MNEINKKCVLGTTIKKLDKKKYQYSLNDKSILFNTENQARKDFKINGVDSSACASKPYISFKALIDNQNQTIKIFKNGLNLILDKLNTYQENELIKNTDLKINSKEDLEKFVYSFLNVEFDHTQGKNNEYKQLLKLLTDKYENEQNKRTLENFTSSLKTAFSGTKNDQYTQQLIKDLENKFKIVEQKTQIEIETLDLSF